MPCDFELDPVAAKFLVGTFGDLGVGSKEQMQQVLNVSFLIVVTERRCWGRMSLLRETH